MTGCGFLQPRDDTARFYLLAAPHNPAVIDSDAKGRVTRLKVGLRSVEGAAYLRSKAIVIRTGPNEVRFMDSDLWAEPLDKGIARIVTETLGSLANIEIVSIGANGDDALDYELAIRILACEGVRLESGENAIRFSATWEIRSANNDATLTRRGAFTAEPKSWDGKDYSQLAWQLSVAIATMTTEVAAALPITPVTVGNNH